MALLGDDGRGFDLARRLESSGVWRTWLGDSIYLSFNHCLSSPSSWEAFMRVDESKSRAQIQLQLRVRALLYDKATVSLFLRSHSISGASSSDVSKLNHNYLQLHGDDVYYTLENASPESGFQRDGGLRHNQSIPKSLSKPSFNSGRRGSESDFSNLASQRSRFEELPDTWYTQFISRCGFKYGMSVGGQESDKRTPEGMSTYLRAVDTHKRKRAPFIEDRSTGSSGHMGRSNMHPSSGFDGSSSDDDILFPETIFRMNCVPETALSPIVRTQDDDVRTEFYGVLDTLPQVNRSHVMIERLGMMPEYLRMEDRGVLRRKKAEKMGFSDEQATQVSRKVVARMLLTMGFEGATEVPVDVFSQLVSRHISKLGRILKVLTDSYKKECSAVQLIKMFLNTTGYNNLGGLAELVKDGTRMIHHPQNQKQPQVLQQQLHMQQQAHSRLPQQIQRQMHPQMQQMVNPQSLQQQQLLERMRKRQVTSPRPNMDMEKDRPLVQVKLENPSEMAVDGNAFNPMNPRHQQQIHQQFRQQQQIAALSNMQQQQQQQPGYNQFRQLASMQIPQMQTPTTGTVRAQPVKVEGFEQLMGGDSSLKHETEDKLRSPPTK